MRLIEDQDVADSIMAYHSFIKFLESGKQIHINSITLCRENMYDIFNISFLGTAFTNEGQLIFINTNKEPPKLNIVGQDLFNKFIAKMENAKIEATAYSDLLIEMQERSDRLLNFLKNKYHIKEN